MRTLIAILFAIVGAGTMMFVYSHGLADDFVSARRFESSYAAGNMHMAVFMAANFAGLVAGWIVGWVAGAILRIKS